jgi:predicted phage terminase large subunit-like protein
MLDSRESRDELRKTLTGFKITTLPHYLTLEPADFHREMDDLLGDHSLRFLSMIGFRGCGKSSAGTVALPIWLALEYPDFFPFIVLVAETRDAVIELIANIRYELEENVMILNDYGDMSDGVSKQKEWTKTSIILKNGVKILGLSRGQRIRGRRHRENRPSIVVVDDPEEIQKVDKKEYRDKTEKWIRGEVIPAIEESRARLIVLGNILHTDAIMARLRNDDMFTHRDYALFKDGDAETVENCTWRAKYPTQQAIDNKKKEVRHTSWMREYKLKVVPPEGQEVKEEWIQYYDAIPSPYHQRNQIGQIVETTNPIARAGYGVDLAISKSQTADCTAMVGGVVAEEIILEGEVAKKDGLPKIYILPNPINKRISLHETIKQLEQIYNDMRSITLPTFYMEDVGYQRAAIEEAQRHGLPAVPMRVGTDKRSRLRAAAIFIQNGTVLFPRKGAEDLIAQLCGFGIEEHDDLVDAFVHLVMGIRAGGMTMPDVIVLG